MDQFIEEHGLILMEAAVGETLEREYGIPLHPSLFNGPAIYDARGRAAMRTLVQSYIDVAHGSGLPILLLTPTWRANAERVAAEPGMAEMNADAVALLEEMRRDPRNRGGVIRIGGLIGCRNDAYDPSQGLPCREAERFHRWQVDRLAEAGVDFLVAETVPAIEEATGMAKAMAGTGLPYFVSFVIDRTGRLLDGTPLADGVDRMDAETRPRPTGYMVNCAYPTFLRASEQPESLFQRLVGCQANASSLDHGELDGAADHKAESVEDWGRAMVNLHRLHGVTILGGCCGTRKEHLEYIVRHAPN